MEEKIEQIFENFDSGLYYPQQILENQKKIIKIINEYGIEHFTFMFCTIIEEYGIFLFPYPERFFIHTEHSDTELIDKAFSYYRELKQEEKQEEKQGQDCKGKEEEFLEEELKQEEQKEHTQENMYRKYLNFYNTHMKYLGTTNIAITLSRMMQKELPYEISYKILSM